MGGAGGGGGTDGQATPSDGSLKVPRAGKQPNRWSGLWGGSAKARYPSKPAVIFKLLLIFFEQAGFQSPANNFSYFFRVCRH
jgi:hypothetical protein